jgi:transposase-like protein
MRFEYDEACCYVILRNMRWPKRIACPYCARERVTTHTRSVSTPRRRYLCLSCRRTFSDLTATPLARTNLPLGKWFRSLLLVGNGLGTAELAKEIRVKWDTAAHMQRRLAAGLSRPGFFRRLREALKENHDS